MTVDLTRDEAVFLLSVLNKVPLSAPRAEMIQLLALVNSIVAKVEGGMQAKTP